MIIVGLGNPGKKYSRTKHNVGFLAVDYLIKNWSFSPLHLENKLKSEITINSLNNEKIVAVKPQTFMNNSGEAVIKLKKKYNAKNEEIIIIHDDLDIEWGKIKLSFNRGSAGHKGIESIIQKLGNKNFYRIRVGILNEKLKKLPKEKKIIAINKYILNTLTKKDMEKTQSIFENVKNECEKLITK